MSWQAYVPEDAEDAEVKTRQPELHDSINKMNPVRGWCGITPFLHPPHPPQGPRFTAGLLRDLLCQAQGVFRGIRHELLRPSRGQT